MQFKVPQNIDMADRIVGPLTLVQFLYVLVGGIVIYFLFSTIGPVQPTLFLGLSVPIGLFFLALAFLKVQDQPFPKFVSAFFIYLFRPKARIWYKEGFDPQLIITSMQPDKKKAVEHKTIKKSQLDRLVQVLDTGEIVPVQSKSAYQEPPANHIKPSRPVVDDVRKKHG